MSYFEIQKMRKLRKLSKKQERNLKELAEKPDSEIDTSDIPELTKEQLSKMTPFKWHKHKYKKRR